MHTVRITLANLLDVRASHHDNGMPKTAASTAATIDVCSEMESDWRTALLVSVDQKSAQGTRITTLMSGATTKSAASTASVPNRGEEVVRLRDFIGRSYRSRTSH